MLKKRALAVGLVGVLAPLAGCDQLFPELTGADNVHDLAVYDASGDMPGSTIFGTVCRLADLRAPSSCTTPIAGRVVTIQETKVSTTTSSTGTFVLSAAGVGTKATIAITDPQGVPAAYVPTVSVLTGSVLTASRETGVLLPDVDAQAYANVAYTNGANDDTRGAVIAWIVSPAGASVVGAVATRITNAIGPLYDVNDEAQLETGSATSTYGTVAFMDLLPGTASIAIAAPASSGLSGDSFPLPVYSGAVTVGALALP